MDNDDLRAVSIDDVCALPPCSWSSISLSHFFDSLFYKKDLAILSCLRKRTNK